MIARLRLLIAVAAGIVWLAGMTNDLAACDTRLALGDATTCGHTILGKNSDRPRFDCQPLLFHPRQKWPTGSKINLGRVTIPQVQQTYSNPGSSPYWCWGYEEGINEHGVAIGNEGIHTRVMAEESASHKAAKGPPLGPTGMDLLRLGLERAKTAREAVDVITGLAEQYGQFGAGVPRGGSYHNSYIIADPKEAWILETAGVHWVAKRLTHGIESISNAASLHSDQSYWWLFRDLYEKARKNDGRTQMVREAFDALEKDFEAGAPNVIRKAVALRDSGRAAEASRVLDDYSAACVNQVLAKLHYLRDQFQ